MVRSRTQATEVSFSLVTWRRLIGRFVSVESKRVLSGSKLRPNFKSFLTFAWKNKSRTMKHVRQRPSFGCPFVEFFVF
jgi:hypothetical protein